jgi:hypothetical protein
MVLRPEVQTIKEGNRMTKENSNIMEDMTEEEARVYLDEEIEFLDGLDLEELEDYWEFRRQEGELYDHAQEVKE